MRTIALVAVWASLLYSVINMVLSGSGDPQFLAQLALLAWLGGLVANELIRTAIFKWKEIRGS